MICHVQIYKKNRSTSNQVGNAFQTLLFTDFATYRQNAGAQHAFIPFKYIL